MDGASGGGGFRRAFPGTGSSEFGAGVGDAKSRHYSWGRGQLRSRKYAVLTGTFAKKLDSGQAVTREMAALGVKNTVNQEKLARIVLMAVARKSD